jgi:hypothetical protein
MNVFFDSGARPSNPSLVGGTLTAIKVFPSTIGPGFNNGGGLGYPVVNPIVPPAPTSGTKPFICTIPGTGQFEQQQIEIRASGLAFVHGTSPTLNFALQSGTSLTPTSNTTVAVLASAQSLTTGAYYPWYFDCKFQADALSGIGQFQNATFSCNGVSGTVTLTDLTGVNLNTTNVNFVMGVSFAVSDALNVGVLSQFQLGT